MLCRKNVYTCGPEVYTTITHFITWSVYVCVGTWASVCLQVTYMLTHGFRRHTGDIPEVLITYCTRAQPKGGTDKRRGYFPICLIKPWVNQFVAKEQCSLYNITQHCTVYKKYTLPASAILTVRLLVLGICQARKLSSYGFPGYKYVNIASDFRLQLNI